MLKVRAAKGQLKFIGGSYKMQVIDSKNLRVVNSKKLLNWSMKARSFFMVAYIHPQEGSFFIYKNLFATNILIF